VRRTSKVRRTYATLVQNKMNHTRLPLLTLLTVISLTSLLILSYALQSQPSTAAPLGLITPTASHTPTITPTITLTPTVTLTPTITITPTVTITPTITITPTVTITPTATITPSNFAYLAFINREELPTPTPTFTPTPTPTLPPTITLTPTLIPPDNLANETSIMMLINEQRQANGLPALSLVAELTQAARRHSWDMATNNLTQHTGSDGTNGGQRMREAGYNWSWWGEIIGWGFGGDPQRMVNWWMNSPTHRNLILSATPQDLGVGYRRDVSSEFGHYWTVVVTNYSTAECAEGAEKKQEKTLRPPRPPRLILCASNL
jgi:uncharacterized protein YkwD